MISKESFTKIVLFYASLGMACEMMERGEGHSIALVWNILVVWILFLLNDTYTYMLKDHNSFQVCDQEY